MYLLNDLLNLVVIIVVAIHFNHSNSLGTGAVPDDKNAGLKETQH